MSLTTDPTDRNMKNRALDCSLEWNAVLHKQDFSCITETMPYSKNKFIIHLEKAYEKCKPPPGHYLTFLSHDHLILHMPFPIGDPLEPSLCLLWFFFRYLHPRLSGTWPWPFSVLPDVIGHMTIWYPSAFDTPLEPNLYFLLF